MNPQTDPPSEEFVPIGKLRGKSLDKGLQRANLAAWLLPDADPEDLGENDALTGNQQVSEPSEAKRRDSGKRRKKPTTRRRWLGFFS